VIAAILVGIVVLSLFIILVHMILQSQTRMLTSGIGRSRGGHIELKQTECLDKAPAGATSHISLTLSPSQPIIFNMQADSEGSTQGVRLILTPPTPVKVL